MVSNHLRSPNFRSWLMKTSLVNAFAVVRLPKIQEFHLWQWNTNTPNCPYLSLHQCANQQNSTDVLSYYSMLICTNGVSLLWTLQFFHSNDEHPLADKLMPANIHSRMAAPKVPKRLDLRRSHKSNYELFNCNNFNIRYWSWNYRGCWHQTCPPIDPR